MSQTEKDCCCFSCHSVWRCSAEIVEKTDKWCFVLCSCVSPLFSFFFFLLFKIFFFTFFWEPAISFQLPFPTTGSKIFELFCSFSPFSIVYFDWTFLSDPQKKLFSLFIFHFLFLFPFFLLFFFFLFLFL